MPRISQLTALTTADNTDELAIVDTSASVTKKITRGDLLKAPLPANSITTTAITNDSVTAEKLVNGNVNRRIGGSATNWQTPGTTTYDTSALNVNEQIGAATSTDNTTNSNNGSFSTSTQTVTFPVPYTQPPHVSLTPQGDHAFATVTATTTTTFSWRGRSPANINANVSITWVSKGI